MASWAQDSDFWVMAAADEDLLKVIELVAAAGPGLDENGGDWWERVETIQWLASRGQAGRDWGHAAEHARAIGSWVGE